MTHQARTTPLYIRLGVLLLAAFLLFGLSPLSLTAHAASTDGWHENIELTGDFSGRFTFNSNTSEIFHVDNAAPGDSWSGDITIRNKTGRTMRVALLTIASELEDTTLFDALTLDIQIDEDTVYSGSYNVPQDRVTQFYRISSGSSLVMHVTVAFPPHHGNELMGKEMDSTWTFEARYPDDYEEPIKYSYTVKYLEKGTREPLLPAKEGYAMLGAKITEQAAYIEGYTPDADEKTIRISSSGNYITFYYEKIDSDPPEPTTNPEPPDPGPDPSVEPSPEPTSTPTPSTDPTPVPSAEPTPEPTPVPSAEPTPTPTPVPSTEPSPEPSAKPSGVQTGNDLRESNTMTVIYGLLAGICLLAITVIWLKVRAVKRRAGK